MGFEIKKKILIVDDEMIGRHLLNEILKKQFQVIEAQNGIEAVQLALTENPDIIVMDLVMPMMDGITACTQIRKEASTAKIPIIMLTAIDYYLNKKLAKNAGVDRYLTKPYDKQVLTSTISRLVDNNSEKLESDCSLHSEDGI
jgi:CheY-like chemotaxis protein